MSIHFFFLIILAESFQITTLYTIYFQNKIVYKYVFVFNIDETAVHINNGSTKTIASIGLDDIVIEGKQIEKECFTAIGTL